MAQTLKPEIKDRIINAALDLMLEKGLNNTDMRSIARRADITSGNLYRYFNGKDDLLNAIIGPLLAEINEILDKHTNGALSVLQGVEEGSAIPLNLRSHEQIFKAFEVIICESLLALHKKGKQHPKIMKVLMQNDLLRLQIFEWVKTVASKGFGDVYLLKDDSEQTSKMVAIAINGFTVGFCSGISVILGESVELEETEYEKIIKFYLAFHFSYLKQIAEEQIAAGNIIIKNNARS